MKKNTLLISLFLFPIILLGQDWDIDFGRSYRGNYQSKIQGKEVKTFFLGSNLDYYYINVQSKKRNEIFQFDYNHDLIKMIPVGKSRSGEKLENRFFLKLNSHDFLISSHFHRFSMEEFFYARKLDKNGTLEQPGKPIFTFVHPTMNSTGYQNTDFRGYSISPDSSKIVFAMTGNVDMKSKAGKEDYEVYVFDKTFKKLWKKVITLPDEDQKIRVIKVQISDQGEVFFIAKKVEKETRKEPWIPKGDYFILKINKEGKEIIKTLNLKGSYPISVVSFLNKGSFYIAGIYTDGIKERSGADGVFMMSYEQGEELLSFNKIPFESSIKKYLVPNKFKGRQPGFFNFEIDDLLIDYKNENFVFVAENRYSTYSFGGYYSEDIIACQLSFTGELNWDFHKHKKYSGKGSNYGLTHRNGDIYLMYNTYNPNQRGKELRHNLKSKITSSYTDIIIINSDGEIEYEDTLFYSSELEEPFLPGFSKRIDNQRVLLLFGDDEYFQYGTLKFK